MTGTPDRAYLHRIEARIRDLYVEGHATGYGAGRADHDRAGCAGCDEVRGLSHDWDRWWADWSASREWERLRSS